MAHMQQAWADFGQEIGLELADLPVSGEMQFQLSDGSLLGVVNGEDEVLVHLAQPLHYDAAQVALGMMKHAAAVRDARRSVQVGLRTTPAGQWLVLGTRLEEGDVSARRIQEAFDFLKHWRMAAEQEG
ncbi:hypothetical protein SDC9_64579 [bioreactor metagenome]|uniref:Type III secretion chaperone SycN n=1 Tax=bioreactor metagenome TaxID=1076179 RepID=A0A644XV45_9ZZZZ